MASEKSIVSSVSSEGGISVQAERIVEDWIVEKTLGKGGFSWVKLGRHVETNKKVALKFTKKNPERAAKQASQIATEINILTSIKHPNIIKLYYYNLDCPYPSASGVVDTLLLVLEYASGGELFDILYYTNRFPEEVARTYFSQLISGIKVLHENGIIHRDIKPQNCLLDKKYRLKISDFGLSKMIQEGDDMVMKTKCGTPAYQAPELIINRPYTGKCDIFSAGVVLFIMLTGHQPFLSADISDSWFKYIAKEKYYKFWNKHGDMKDFVSEEAKDLLQKLLCYQPRNRFELDEIISHPWCGGDILSQAQMIAELSQRRESALNLRVKDNVRKLIFSTSGMGEDSVTRSVEGIEIAGENLSLHEEPPAFSSPLPLMTSFHIKDNVSPMSVLRMLHSICVESACIDKYDVKKYDLCASFDVKNANGKNETIVQINIFKGNVLVFQKLSGTAFAFQPVFNLLLDSIISDIELLKPGDLNGSGFDESDDDSEEEN